MPDSMLPTRLARWSKRTISLGWTFSSRRTGSANSYQWWKGCRRCRHIHRRPSSQALAVNREKLSASRPPGRLTAAVVGGVAAAVLLIAVLLLLLL